MKKWIIGLSSLVLSVQLHANITNNQGIEKLEKQLIQLLEAKNVSEKNSQDFLKQNGFNLDEIDWKKNGNVIHGPFYLQDGHEEVEVAIPYVFAFNQGKKVVGVGGHLSDELVRKLKRISTVACYETKLKNAQIPSYHTCYHQASIKPKTVQQFKKAFTYLVYHSN